MKDDSKTQSARAEFLRLRNKLNELRGLKRELNDMQKSPAMSPVLAMFRRQIEETKELLCTGDKKDFEKMQANVLARRILLQSFECAYDQATKEAAEALAEFEKQNALFIGDAADADENGELKDGTTN